MPVALPSLPPIQWSLSQASLPTFGKSDRHISQTLGDLVSINAKVNSAINPSNAVAEIADAWLVNPEQGWCGDYAVTKQRELIKLGWSRGSVLLAEVLLDNGEHHAVLVAKLNVGYLVLDNLTDKLLPPTKTKYTWLRMQNERDPETWFRWSEK